MYGGGGGQGGARPPGQATLTSRGRPPSWRRARTRWGARSRRRPRRGCPSRPPAAAARRCRPRRTRTSCGSAAAPAGRGAAPCAPPRRPALRPPSPSSSRRPRDLGHGQKVSGANAVIPRAIYDKHRDSSPCFSVWPFLRSKVSNATLQSMDPEFKDREFFYFSIFLF